jgi:hypothetical protein
MARSSEPKSCKPLLKSLEAEVLLEIIFLFDADSNKTVSKAST